jgi:hypothetical protein
VDLPHLIGDARVVEDALGHGRFTRINVSHDANIAITIYWSFTHYYYTVYCLLAAYQR